MLYKLPIIIAYTCLFAFLTLFSVFTVKIIIDLLQFNYYVIICLMIFSIFSSGYFFRVSYAIIKEKEQINTTVKAYEENKKDEIK